MRKQFLYSPEVVWTIKKQNSRQEKIGLVESKHNLHNCIKEASPLQKGSGDNRKTNTKDNILHFLAGLTLVSLKVKILLSD